MPLTVTRLADAPHIYPPGHTNVQPQQLHGGAHSPTTDLSVILSHYLPGGRADADTMPAETVYFVLAGEIVVTSGDQEATLHPYDSIRLPTGATRVMENRGPLPASILVIRSTHSV